MNNIEAVIDVFAFIRERDIPIFVDKYFKQLGNSKSNFPKPGKRYNLFSKYKKKRELDKLLNDFTLKISDSSIFDNPSEQSELFNRLKLFFIQTLEFGQIEAEIFFNDDFNNLVNEFLKKASEFDNTLTSENLFQAIRNVWIMNTIQLLFNKKVELTPSIFAYSMLYPYSDNYLDDTSISKIEKLEFLHRFGLKLAGEKVYHFNEIEEKIFALVEMIEEEFPRYDYNSVYESLLAIHYGQVKSISQNKCNAISEELITKISIEKGGSSVLADAYLVLGNLNYEEADFMFGFGVFLQLIDDLQDIADDKENQHITLFSKEQSKDECEKKTNKLFNFINHVLLSQEAFEKGNRILNIINYSCTLLIIDSIACHKNLYPFLYKRKIGSHSLYPLYYYRKLHSKINNTLEFLGSKKSF
ncbi:MAG: class 1 isoprenoid biosynthesis enzyme [Melioribacteraceae bacterium]|nr:class 1 isoprenoid biosynthesis enzyme [Melioribacteraceae bacterium]